MSLWLLALAASAQPQFSRSHGIIEESEKSISVTITSGSGATIRYTTDGSAPTATSTKYTVPLTFTGSTVLRAVEQIGDSLSPVATATYIFVKSVLNQPNNPEGYPDTWGEYTLTWGTAVADYEMDQEMTQDATLRPKIIEGLKQLPVLSIVSDKDNFFSHENDEEKGGIYIFTGPPVGDATGHGWTRPASVELFGGPQKHDLSTTCGVRLHGGHGRLAEKNPKHSFRLVFKEKYGPKTLKYPLFKDNEGQKFDQLVLRCHFGNAWQHWNEGNREMAQYTRDVWARRMQRKMGHTSVNALYVHLFLNGMYWGLYNLAERVDDQYGKDHLGGKKSEVDIIKIEEDEGNHFEASEGTLDAWKQMTNVARQAATDNSAYELLKDSLLDIDNFIDYMLINHYAGNDDWDHHNWYAIRRHNNDSAKSEGFRLLCWDSEIIFTNNNYYDSYSKNNGFSKECGYPTGIFHSLMQNPQFAKQYIRRAKALLADDGLLGEKSVREVWDSLYHTIDKALYMEAARWGDYRRDVESPYRSGRVFTVDDAYMTERNRLINQYFPVRSGIVLDKLLSNVQVDDFELPEGWVPMTKNMFHVWTTPDASAQISDNDNYGSFEWNVGQQINGYGTVAGDGDVRDPNYVDVSQYDKIVLRGTGDGIRILANRALNKGPWKEVVFDINENNPYWDKDLKLLIIPLDIFKTGIPQRANEERIDDFVHINAIKCQNGHSAKVMGIYLIPKSEPVVEPDPEPEPEPEPEPVVDNINTLNQLPSDGWYYNFKGQRVLNPVRGSLYIRNGKKVIMK